jgi:DNA-binding transcriptional regulator YdaS (Cro superfamily)
MKPYDQIKIEQSFNLNKLVSYAGSKPRLARALNVHKQTVYDWVKRGRISALCAIEAEKITKGYITKEDLRPDVENWMKE